MATLLGKLRRKLKNNDMQFNPNVIQEGRSKRPRRLIQKSEPGHRFTWTKCSVQVPEDNSYNPLQRRDEINETSNAKSKPLPLIPTSNRRFGSKTPTYRSEKQMIGKHTPLERRDKVDQFPPPGTRFDSSAIPAFSERSVRVRKTGWKKAVAASPHGQHHGPADGITFLGFSLELSQTPGGLQVAG